MKNKFKLLAVVLLQTYSLVSQTTYWVSNRNDGVEVDFTSLQTAYDMASSGDTIILYPSPIGYGSLSVFKKIHIKGLGYRFDYNSQPTLGVKTFAQPSIISGFGIHPGGDESSFESLYIGSFALYNVHNVTIRRCEINNGLSFANSINNNVQSCYINHGAPGNAISFVASTNNTIQNCYSNTASGTSLLTDANSINNLIIHNVFNTMTAYNSSIYNNIFLSNMISGSMNEILHNVFLGGSPGEDENNNIYGASNVFVGYPNLGSHSFDSRYQLEVSSPAIGAGLDGEDCGMFGGANPYKLSGIHNLPLIYELTVPQNLPNGSDLNITVKVRAED